MALIHKHTNGGTAKIRLVKVRAGCSVRMNLKILDGGAALDWTDGNLVFNDLYIWSDARRGIIGKPTWSVDSDDPTILHADYSTAASDLPGAHKLQVNVTYGGWQMVHTVPVYWLTGNLYVEGQGTEVVTSDEVTETDLTLSLQDVTTTFLQSLIKQMTALCQGESERLTILEGLLEQTDENAEDLDGRLTTVEGSVKTNSDSIEDLSKTVDSIKETLDGSVTVETITNDEIDELMEKN